MIKRYSALVLLIGGTFVAVLQTAESMSWLPDLLAPPATETIVPRRDIICGPRSLHTALSLLSIPVTVEEITRECKVRAGGVAFRDLVTTALNYGASATLRELSWRELNDCSTVCVLFVDGNHYVVADCRKPHDHGIIIYDSAEPPQFVDRSSLERRWKGEALVLSANPDRNGLVFETLWKDAGFTHNEQQAFRVAVTNESEVPMDLRVQGTSCSCTSCVLTAEVIQPGATEYVNGTVSLKGRRGIYQERVQLSSSANSNIELWFCGGRYAPRLVRDFQFLGSHSAGGTFSTTVYVHDPGDHRLSLTSKEMTCELHLANAEKIDCTIDVQQIDNKDPAIGTLATFKIAPNDYRVTLSGRIPDHAVPQDIKGTLTILTALKPPLDNIAVTLSGRVVVPAECNPPAILLDAKLPNPEITLTLLSKMGEDIHFIGSEFSLPEISVDVQELTENSSGKQKSLRVRFEIDDHNRFTTIQKLTLRSDVGNVDVPVLFGQLRPALVTPTNMDSTQ